MQKENKPRKIRKNKFKKNARPKQRRWPGRIWVGLKVMILVAVLLAASALFMAGYSTVTRMAYFQTKQILISGNHRLSQAAILTQTGIHMGDNLLALNLRLVRERLLADPWIDEVRVFREIPQTLTIEVEEHQPLARVDLGRIYLMDTKGRIFKSVGKHDDSQLPLISGIEYADIHLGKNRVSPNVTAILRVLEMSKVENNAIAYHDLEKIHIDKELGIMLTLKQEQVRIQLGFDQYEKKLDRLEKLQHLLAGKRKWHNYKTIDLNDPDRVVVQFDPIG